MEEEFPNQIPGRTMEWYKALVKVLLYIESVVTVWQATFWIAGTIHCGVEGNPDAFYMGRESMRTVDKIVGYAYILIAVLFLVARYQLAKFKKFALRWFYVAMALNLLVVFLYNMIFQELIMDVWYNMYVITLDLIFAIIFTILNVIYFQKRKTMFVNEK